MVETMTELLGWPDRLYVAGLLAVAGGTFVVLGARELASVRGTRRSWPEWALEYLYVFRAVVVGLCLVGAAVGLAGQVAWLLAASACIAIGELLESSYYIAVLEWARRSAALRPRTVGEPERMF